MRVVPVESAFAGTELEMNESNNTFYNGDIDDQAGSNFDRSTGVGAGNPSAQNIVPDESDLYDGEDEVASENGSVYGTDPNLKPDDQIVDPEENEDVLPVGDNDLDPESPVDLDHPEQTPTGRHPLPGDYGYDKAIKDPNAPNPFFKEVENPDGIAPEDPSEPVEPRDPSVPVIKGVNSSNSDPDGIGADFPDRDSTTPPLRD